MKRTHICFLTLLAASPAFAHGNSAAIGGPGDPKAVGRVILINAEDIKFDPRTITVHVGETVKFVITNHGSLPHEFVLGDKAEQDGHEKEMQAMGAMQHADPNAVSVKPGETKSLIWRFGAVGTLEYACHIPGHYAAGMVDRKSVV